MCVKLGRTYGMVRFSLYANFVRSLSENRVLMSIIHFRWDFFSEKINGISPRRVILHCQCQIRFDLKGKHKQELFSGKLCMDSLDRKSPNYKLMSFSARSSTNSLEMVQFRSSARGPGLIKILRSTTVCCRHLILSNSRCFRLPNVTDFHFIWRWRAATSIFDILFTR